MPFEKHILQSPTGSELAVLATKVEQPKAVIHINHGMAEHAARYERFADTLGASGYGAVAHDHRGHGETRAADAPLGHFGSDGWNKVMADAKAVNDWICGARSGTPIVCFGHSMGAIIALNYAMRFPQSIAALAPWNSGVENGFLTKVLRTLLKSERFFKGSDVPSSFARKLTFDAWNREFAPNRTGFDWLSRDKAEVDAYVAESLCGFDVTTGLWLDVLDGIAFAARDDNLKNLPKDLPVHLLAGEKDPCSEHGKAVENIAGRMRALAMKDVSLTILEGTRHESLNEINRDATQAAFIEWLEGRFG